MLLLFISGFALLRTFVFCYFILLLFVLLLLLSPCLTHIKLGDCFSPIDFHRIFPFCSIHFILLLRESRIHSRSHTHKLTHARLPLPLTPIRRRDDDGSKLGNNFAVGVFSFAIFAIVRRPASNATNCKYVLYFILFCCCCI